MNSCLNCGIKLRSMLNNPSQGNNLMIFLFKLVVVFVCSFELVNACGRGLSLDEIDLETGKIIKGAPAVIAKNDVPKQQGGDHITEHDVENALHELSTGRRSYDVAEDNIKDDAYLLCLKDAPLTRKRLYYGGVIVSWVASLGLVLCECGAGACDIDGGMMIGAYAVAGLGAVLAVRGFCIS